MSKILIIENCNHCHHFENNMYHGSCCWHHKVVKPCEDGHTPKKIRGTNDEGKPWIVGIPSWCPLEESNNV